MGVSIELAVGNDLTPTYNGQLNDSWRMWLIGYDCVVMLFDVEVLELFKCSIVTLVERNCSSVVS